MNFNQVGIEAMAYALPPDVVSSDQIEDELSGLYERLGLPKGRLELMTGIKERRFWPAEYKPSQASADAGNELLSSGIDPEGVDLLIHSAVCRDRLEPATASYVHRLMNLPGKTQILDVSNACLGFLNATILAAGMIESGQIKRAIIVAGENGKPLAERTIDLLNEGKLDRQQIKPYFANLTIGAGAVAWSVAHLDLIEKPGPVLGSSACLTDTSHNELCEGDTQGDGLIMQTDSEELLHAGISVASRTWDKFTELSGWSFDTPELVVTHQVGKAHTKAVFDALGLDMARNFSTFETLGNCGSVSLPITYTLACEANPDFSMGPATLLGIGSGLSSLMLSLNP